MKAEVIPAVGEGRRWLIYALGGGLGHLTRAIALARVAGTQGRIVRILTNTPFGASARFEPWLGPTCSLVRIDPSFDRDAVKMVLDSVLGPADFDVLIVDTFPRGLGGELTPWLEGLDCPKILIHRDINPSYVAWADLRKFAGKYNLVILPGEDAPLGDLVHAVRTAPWLLCDASGILDRDAARIRLNTPSDERSLIVVVGCGRSDEIEIFRALSDRLDQEFGNRALVRMASLFESPNQGPTDIAIWPLMVCMAGIDVLVGSGGYNTVYEARATGTPLVALAQHRLYDRQERRLLPDERADDANSLMRLVGDQLARQPERTRLVPEFENGAHKAVELIDRLTTSGMGNDCVCRN